MQQMPYGRGEIMMAGRLILCAVLLADGIQDLRKREICFWLTVLAGGAGMLYRLASCFLVWQAEGVSEGINCLSAIGTALLPGAVILLLSAWTGGRIGFGDGLSVILIGSWLLAGEVLLILLFAAILIFPVAFVLAVKDFPERKKTELPFLPVLFLAYLLEWFFF